MITEGNWEMLAKVAQNRGVIGFWYPNTLTFLFIFLCLAIAIFFMFIGVCSFISWLLSRKKKKRPY